MSTIVVGEVPADEFALFQTFNGIPNVEFECERVVENGEEVSMPILWARADDVEREVLDRALEADDSVSEFSVLADFEDEWLYRMTWVSQIELVLHILLNARGTILDCYGDEKGWRIRIFYPERDALSATQEFCTDYGLTFDVVRIREMDEEPTGRFGLTDEQYRALTIAWEEGYFDVPRAVQLEDLAEDLDISHQSLSERIRRAHANLIEETLGISAPR